MSTLLRCALVACLFAPACGSYSKESDAGAAGSAGVSEAVGGAAGSAGMAPEEGGAAGEAGSAGTVGAAGSSALDERLQLVYDRDGSVIENRYLDTKVGLECSFVSISCTTEACLPADVASDLTDGFDASCAFPLQLATAPISLGAVEYVTYSSTISCTVTYAYRVTEITSGACMVNGACVAFEHPNSYLYQVGDPVPNEYWVSRSIN